MLNPSETSIELKKYLKKLSNVIREEASFVLIGSKIIDKKKIDDILCCVEASFPDEYRAFVKTKSLKSYFIYLRILDAIRNKFFFSTTVYKVRHNEALSLIESMTRALDSDINFVFNDQSGMF